MARIRPSANSIGYVTLSRAVNCCRKSTGDPGAETALGEYVGDVRLDRGGLA